MPNDENKVPATDPAQPDMDKEPANAFMNKPESQWTVDDAKEAKQYATELAAQKKHWRDKADKAATKAEPNPNDLKTKEGKDDLDLDNKVDERFLRRDNFSDEQIELLKKIQALNKLDGKNITLVDCAKDPLFASHLEAQKAEAKRIGSQLGASNGSPYAAESPEVDLPKTPEGRIDRNAFKKKFFPNQ